MAKEERKAAAADEAGSTAKNRIKRFNALATQSGDSMENNNERMVCLRRNQNALVVIGLGVIAFGIWSVIKAVLYTAFNMEAFLDLSADSSLDRNLGVVIFWIFMGIVLVIDLALRLHVGLSAVAEGRGRKKRHAYIVLALLMALISLMTVIASIVIAASGYETTAPLGSLLVALIVELTSGILLVEMAVSAIKVKSLEKKRKKEPGYAA